MKYLLFFGLALFSLNTIAANLPNFPFVVSKGSAEKKVMPDKATVHISFLSFSEESGVALDNLNSSSEKLFSLLEKYKIDLKNLDARDIRKDTKRKKDRDYNRLEILGYEVSRSMTLNLKDLKTYPSLMNDLIAIENLSSISTVFDTVNRVQFEADLMNEAGADARSRADLMAKSLGAKVQSVYAISQESDFGSFFATFGAPEVSAFYEREGGGSSRTRMLVPEHIYISQSINVVFRIK